MAKFLPEIRFIPEIGFFMAKFLPEIRFIPEIGFFMAQKTLPKSDFG